MHGRVCGFIDECSLSTRLISVERWTMTPKLLWPGQDFRPCRRCVCKPGEVKWETASSGSERATHWEGWKTGAIELFARYPAGHVFPSHWHSASEHTELTEDRISIEEGEIRRF